MNYKSASGYVILKTTKKILKSIEINKEQMGTTPFQWWDNQSFCGCADSVGAWEGCACVASFNPIQK